jgi:uncharacterized membrane protein
MVSELIRAVFAAVLVGVLPGWFWAGWLVASTDCAERLAYSVALSVTLVTTAALAQAHLFAARVTLLIAVSSVSVMLLAGLAAYLRFGPAKSTPRLSSTFARRQCANYSSSCKARVLRSTQRKVEQIVHLGDALLLARGLSCSC